MLISSPAPLRDGVAWQGLPSKMPPTLHVTHRFDRGRQRPSSCTQLVRIVDPRQGRKFTAPAFILNCGSGCAPLRGGPRTALAPPISRSTRRRRLAPGCRHFPEHRSSAIPRPTANRRQALNSPSQRRNIVPGQLRAQLRPCFSSKSSWLGSANSLADGGWSSGLACREFQVRNCRKSGSTRGHVRRPRHHDRTAPPRRQGVATGLRRGPARPRP